MIKVEFSGATADEVNEQVKDYASKIKGSRGGKGGKDDGEAQTGTAPPPMQPPAGGPPPLPAGGMPNFAPPAGGAATPGAFPAAGAPIATQGPSPEVAALVQRINARIDGAIASGQPTDAVLQWFRNQCGPEAAQATLDQIKQNLLYKLPVPNLTEIAKMMNA